MSADLSLAMPTALPTTLTPAFGDRSMSPQPYDDRHQDASGLICDLVRYTPIPTLILDALLRVRQVSDSYLVLSNASGPEKLIGQHVDSLFNHGTTHPVLASACKIIRAARDTQSVQQEKCLTGPRTAWNIRAVPIAQHGSLRCVQVEFQDVTSEHLKQLELEERLYVNETFRVLVETVKDYAIFMLDPNGRIATWNAGAEGFKGYTKAEIIGKHFSTFYGKEDLEADKPGRELRDALRDGRVEDEGWRYRSDGSRFWANVVITSVYKDGIHLGFSKVTRDLTERRKAEQKLIAAYEEASKMKSEFLANMSHEIRTPMHGLLSALTLLLDTGLDAEQLDLAHVIQESGDVLLQVINDILDYSKLASGNFSINHDIINVSDIIQSVFRAHQACYQNGVRLENFLDPRLPKAAEGDSLRYRQIIQNLMSNAAKFTVEGYVRIYGKLAEEDTECFTILTEVVDTGIGIPEGSSSGLFTPFTQFDNSATKRYKGTGLGLSICKSLAELMGGSIGFHPNPEGGSVFWFTAKLKKCKHVNIHDVSADKVAEMIPSSPLPTNPMEKMRAVAVGRRLLLAEDNPINRKVMLKMLAGLGFEGVDTARDGKEAVDRASRNPMPYDLILMDVNMPIQDGVSATKELRAKGFQIPIIAMTANALKGQAEIYLAKGMTGYIAKPVDRKLLIKLLMKCLQRDEDD